MRWCRRHGVACFVWGDSNIRGDRATGVKAWMKRKYVGSVLRRSSGAMPFGSVGRAFFLKYGADPNAIFLMLFEPDYDLIAQATEQQIQAAARKFNLPPQR